MMETRSSSLSLTEGANRANHAARPRAASSLIPTLLLCLVVVAGFAAAVSRLTAGGNAWTFETLRRQSAAAGHLMAPPMALRDAQGRPRAAFVGGTDEPEVYLVDFIYTRCLTVCQALGSEYTRMQDRLREAGGVERAGVGLLSISIDPLHDDQAALAAHGRLHRADPAVWRLTAPLNPLSGQAALRQLGVVAIPDGFGGFAHNGTIHLIDRHGRVHRIFDYAAWPQALAEARGLAAHPGTRP